VYFLKYRPQTISELDLASVRKQLEKVLKKGDLPQAFLFAGPKGAGKTSAARIMAKAVNCQKPKGFEPCNKCSSCIEISNGSSLDVIEIDAASNRGIDDIRQLKERVSLAPVSGKCKVYIIDEVHMLTKEAFNALLKTLEEPPKHVVFILCTTDPEKIIPTVLSRLFRVDFHQGTKAEVKRSLQKVITGEKLSVDEKTISAIIEVTEGGFRDAQKFLESLVVSLGKKLTWKKTKEILSYRKNQKPEAIIRMLIDHDLTTVLKISQDLAKSGTDFADYINKILNLLNQLILIKSQAEKGDKYQQQLAEALSLYDLLSLSRLFSRAAIEQKTAIIAAMPFQLAAIEFVEKNRSTEIKPSGQGSNNSTVGQKAAKKIKKSIQKPVIKIKPKQLDKKATNLESKKSNGNSNPSLNIDLTLIESNWSNLLREVKPMNHSVAAFLRAARPKTIDHDTLVLEVFYSFHKDKLEEEQNRRIVEDGLSKICGQNLKMRCVLGKEKPSMQKNNKKNDARLYDAAKEIFG